MKIITILLLFITTTAYTQRVIGVSTTNQMSNTLSIDQFDIVVGNLNEVYPAYTETQRNAIRVTNWTAFKTAYTMCMATGKTLTIPGGIFEFYVSDGQGINASDGTFTMRGVGESSLLRFYPVSGTYNENIFEVGNNDSFNLNISDIAVTGFPSTLETYDATIMYLGDTTKVLLTSAKIRAGFATKVNAGGIKVNVSRELGMPAKRYAVTSYDSITKIMTLGAIELGGRQPPNWVWTSNDAGYIGVAWDVNDLGSSVLTYGQHWAPTTGLGFVNDAHTTLPQGTLDTCKYIFNNVKFSGLPYVINSSWGNTTIEFDNCDVTAQTVAISRFSGTNNLWEQKVRMYKTRLHKVGALSYGQTINETSAGYPNSVNGSGTYLHPNVPVDYIDCIFENNVAVATRSFSSTGNASQFLYPEGAKIYAQNSVWRNNGDQYHYLGSSTLPVIFDDCYFDSSNQIQIQRNVTFNNCILDSTPVTSYGYDDDDLDGFGFTVKFSGCTLNGHTTSAIGSTPSVEYENCQITPSSTTVPFGGGRIKIANSIIKKNTVNSYNALFNDGIPYKGIEIVNTKFDTTQAVRFFDRIRGSYTGGKLRIVNSEFVNQGIAPSSTASSNPNNFDYNVEIVNSKIAGGLYAGISIANIAINQGVDIAAKTAATTSFSDIFTATRWNTSASTLTLNSSNNHFRVNKGTITRIALGSPVNNSLYAGEIYLTAIDTLTFTAYDSISNPNSNVDWTGTVLPKQTVGFYLDPAASLYVGTTTDSLLIGTANGTATLFTKSVDTAIPWFLAGSASITVGAATYTDNGQGRLVDNTGKIVGHLSYFGNTYSINFPVPPVATTQIWLRYQKFNTFHYQGLFRKI